MKKILSVTIVIVLALGLNSFASAKTNKSDNPSKVIATYTDIQDLLKLINNPSKSSLSLTDDIVKQSKIINHKDVIIVACGQECDNGKGLSGGSSGL